LKANILAVEYPGYGEYKHDSISEKIIFEDAEAIYSHLVAEIKVPEQRIFILGRYTVTQK
jgi:hypothetical protein